MRFKDRQKELEARRQRRVDEVHGERLALHGKIQKLRVQIGSRIRLKSRWLFRLVIIATAAAFAGLALVSRSELDARFASFYGLCAAIHDGDPTEAVRGLASERKLIFQLDDDPVVRLDDDIYVLSPFEDWPKRLACKFRSHEARVYKLPR